MLAGVWFGVLLLFVMAMLCWGVKPTFILLLGISIVSLLVLIAFSCVMIPHIDFHKYVLDQKIPGTELPMPLFTHGVKGVFMCMPYCVWW